MPGTILLPILSSSKWIYFVEERDRMNSQFSKCPQISKFAPKWRVGRCTCAHVPATTCSSSSSNPARSSSAWNGGLLIQREPSITNTPKANLSRFTLLLGNTLVYFGQKQAVDQKYCHNYHHYYCKHNIGKHHGLPLDKSKWFMCCRRSKCPTKLLQQLLLLQLLLLQVLD